MAGKHFTCLFPRRTRRQECIDTVSVLRIEFALKTFCSNFSIAEPSVNGKDQCNYFKLGKDQE